MNRYRITVNKKIYIRIGNRP